MMLYKVLFCVTTSFLLDSFVSAGLTTDSSNDYYYGAVVVFNYTMNEQNFSVGSETGTDEVGSYGAHSPILNAHGQVVHSLITKTGITDGCHFDYHRVTKTFPWIALVSRGNCSFADKIDNAIRGNASGIIVYDYKDSQENTIMSHESSQDIVSIIIHHSLASSIAAQVNDGVIVTVDINPGKRHPQPGGKPQKTTIIFVAVSFMILMLVSLAWLVFYYIQRFRIIQAHNRGQRQRQSLTRKVIAKLDTRTVRSGDEVLVNEETCAVCIECYRVGEAVRKLPCGHVYHKKCIDPWLESRQTCPMCKINVIKTLCADDATGQNSQTNESDASYTNQLEIELSDRTASTTGGDQEQLPEVEHPHSSSSEADQPTSSGQQACLKV